MALKIQDIKKLESKFKDNALTIKDNILIFLEDTGFAVNTYAVHLNKEAGIKEISKAIKDSNFHKIGSSLLEDTDYFLVQYADKIKGEPYIDTTFTLHQKYRNKGIGSRIYKTLLNKYDKFNSSYTVSSSARRIYENGMLKGHVDIRSTLFSPEVLDVYRPRDKMVGIYFTFHKEPKQERIDRIKNIQKVADRVNAERKREGKPQITVGISKPTNKKPTNKKPTPKSAPQSTSQKTKPKTDWWDFMSYKDQVTYLKAYPNSKKKITKKPGER